MRLLSVVLGHIYDWCKSVGWHFSQTAIKNSDKNMVTCYLKYVIDPFQLDIFEQYGKKWIELVNRFGGQHHGYFVPSEGANNIAYALFSFNSLAEYENYRKLILADNECQEMFKLANDTKCILSYERTFLRPVFN
jgi:hypothetical protein